MGWPGCLLPHCQIHRHGVIFVLHHSFGKGGHGSWRPHRAQLRQQGITMGAGERLRGHPRCPGHPGAAVGIHVSTPKQEVSDKSGLLCGTQGPAPPFERDLGASHRSLLSQHLGGWAAPRPGQPGCRQPGAPPRPPRAGLHVTGMCRAFAPSLFFIHVGWKNVFMRRVAVALCHGPSAGLFSPQQMRRI